MMADSHGFDSTRAFPGVSKIVRRQLVTPNGSFAGSVLLASAGEHSATFVARNASLPTVTLGQNPTTVIDGIAKAIQTYISETPTPINDGEGSIWLVGWNGHLWSFVHYDIIPCDKFGAIGAASDLAVGAYRAFDVANAVETDPLFMLSKIGDICANESHLCRPPFVYETAEPLTINVGATA